ncbi:Ada metal-binding domain-containing protein [Xanthovirga aplysinae]|uniref:Ada metal-binding domain-containing protein n=1 Tax=Xanthovirga aplysinae TaxID=2529853 RepID=UPI0012BC4FF5|nr:Ada metal-binding domain-containing protein [Xanthovirga aplysinae]MTI32093.1 metal-binding protein [Xanthovirga aplysinae]
MIRHQEIDQPKLKHLIKSKLIQWGGNSKLKIYGTLYCKSGKRMKEEHRVFFFTAQEAINNGYRPCGNCLKMEYKKWKNGLI